MYYRPYVYTHTYYKDIYIKNILIYIKNILIYICILYFVFVNLILQLTT